MPGQTLRIPGVRGFQMSRQSAHEGNNVDAARRTRRLYPPPGIIEPATFWLVAQCANRLHHHVPHIICRDTHISFARSPWLRSLVLWRIEVRWLTGLLDDLHTVATAASHIRHFALKSTDISRSFAIPSADHICEVCAVIVVMKHVVEVISVKDD